MELGSIFGGSEEKREKWKEIGVQSSTGKMKVSNISGYQMSLNWISKEKPSEPITVNVDMMPSISINKDKDEICKDMRHCNEKLKDLAFQIGCFLVGKLCIIDAICWQLSFAACERNLVKDMSAAHMKIFRILKYLFTEKSIIGICDIVSSYVLKTLILRHSYLECTETNSAEECLIQILECLVKSMDDAFLGSLFIPSLNLWQTTIEHKIRNKTENKTICDEQVLTQLSHILKSTATSYENSLIVVVIFEFWKRVFQLISEIFKNSKKGEINQATLVKLLETVYTELNEEDEDDDIQQDYFTDVKWDSKNENDWVIFGSQSFVDDGKRVHVNKDGDSDDAENIFNFRKQDINTAENDDKQGKRKNEEIDDEGNKQENTNSGDDELVNVDDEVDQDEQDEEACIKYIVRELCDDDEETSSDSESDAHFGGFHCEGTTQACQEDVYELNDMFKKYINVVDIPAFSDLLMKISTGIEGTASIIEYFKDSCVATKINESDMGILKKRKFEFHVN